MQHSPIHTSHQSPNFDSRGEHKIDMLILHYTDMRTPERALERLCDGQNASRVSAHYVIREDGEIFQLVNEAHRAWHAGESFWRGHAHINARSIGIEICNPGHSEGYADFPAAQMQSVCALSQAIIARHAIPARNVQGHSDIAFLRKKDPGEKFPWAWLAQHGVGIFPEHVKPISGATLKRGDTGQPVMRLQQSLANWGYGLKMDGEYGEKTEQCVIAFQRHYRPENLDGVWDNTCSGIISALHGLV
jgi:N-acetylmuramoyl-L-alanine amidase